MKLLSLSLDPLILDPHSVVATRNARYGEVLERYDIIVPSPKREVVTLSPNTTVYGTGGSHKLISLMLMCGLMWRLLREDGHEVITSQDTYFLALAGLLCARLLHRGIEVQVLGIEKLTVLRKTLAKFTLSHADSIRVLSHGLKKRLIHEFHIPEEKMMLVPIYVDVSSLGYGESLSEESRREVEKEVALFRERYANRINIVSVNRLVPIKNIDMQLESVAALKEKYPNILLHVVGDGPLRPSLEEKITALGLKDNVILEGAKFGAQLRPFFSESNCFVLTSDFEGYGMVVVEAATAGACIVMTEVGCAGEVIKHEESGLIVKPKDGKAFTDALSRVLGEAGLKERLGNGAERSIAELPSFDKVLEKYKASWQQALVNSKKK
jgi:glycosyltransferase involved in cell wall biosynthesis